MFTLITNLFSLALALLIGIPVLAFFAYLFATFVQGLLGGPIWLWMTLIFVIGLGAAAEEYNKKKLGQEN